MKVLYVVGSCLTKNTSANMSHNAYVQGLLENGCDVDIIMASDSWGEEDKALPRWEKAHYYEYNSVSFADRLRKKARGAVPAAPTQNAERTVTESKAETAASMKASARDIAKKLFYTVFPTDPVYPLEKKWLKQAVRFKSNQIYDLVISNSSPAASHKLVSLLKDSNRISFKRWIQIWEDPWYYDLYGGHTEAIKQEEHALLRAASEVYYVSPLTMEYQKKFYSDCADKMKCIPLPFLMVSEDTIHVSEPSFGYFGDYYSKTRNLQPFYDALKVSGYKGYIYGDSDLHLTQTERIAVSGRVTLDKLAEVQNRTSILVHLCNLGGGQIPGKIYHYSATEKSILFILDGTEEEKKTIRTFFEQFDRYYFCDNTEEDISRTIQSMVSELGKKAYSGIDAFSPRKVAARILGGI